MKRSSINIQLTAFLLLLAGCTQGEPFPGEGDGTNGARTALLRLSSVSTTVAGEGSASATRAEVGTTPLTKGSIGFFVKKDAANGYDEKTNIEGTLSATSGKWEPTSEIWLNEKNATIGIYAPYDKTGQTTPNVLKLNASLRPDDASKDLWCARLTDVSFTNSAPAPTLDHVYTRCVVNVSRAASNKQQAEISGMSFPSTEVYSNADYKLFEASGNYDYSKSVVGFTVPGLTTQTLKDDNPRATYDLLLIPSALTKEVVLQLTVNSRKMRLSIPAVKFSNALERGKKYTLNITLSSSDLTLSSLQYSDWEVVADEIGEDVTFPPDLRYIDVGCSVYFAPADLIATKNDDGTYTYSFASDQGFYSHDGLDFYPDGKGEGGDYFFWNALEPYPAAPPDGLDAERTWDDAKDPCRKVSPEWYTPTQEQLAELLGKSRKRSHYIPLPDKPEVAAISGTFFAAGTLDGLDVSTQDNYLFLPFSSWFKPNGDFQLGGPSMHWSSAKKGHPGRPILLQTIGETTDQMQTATVDNAAAHIRCVRNK